MSILANKDKMDCCYFYPISQSCKLEVFDRPSVRVQVYIPEEISDDKIVIIKRLGNYLSLVSLINMSREISYCEGDLKQDETCGKLTEEEIEECQRLKEYFDPLLLTMIEYKVTDLRISGGDIGQMRRVLDRIRTVVHPETNHSRLYSLLKKALGA